MVSLYVALVHYPVLNRRGETIASAITNLDLHDLARAARTYEIPACFMVTPLQDQQVLIRRLLDHWCQGVGKELHPDREEALKRLWIADDLATVKEAIRQEWGESPVIWATTAKEQPGAMTHRQARRLLARSRAPVSAALRHRLGVGSCSSAGSGRGARTDSGPRRLQSFIGALCCGNPDGSPASHGLIDR